VCFCQQGEVPQVVVGTIVNADSAVLVVRVDRIEGTLPGVAVGGELEATGFGEVGEQLFFAPLMSEAPASVTGALLYQVTDLTIRDGSVRCQVNRDTIRRPVTVDTVIEALRAADTAACVDVLASDDSLWNRSQCEGGSGQGGVEASEGGCNLGVSATAGLSSVALTSAAVFAALAARRYRRNER
jgi:MYXO-CTERM domain-containing protein